VVDWDHGLGGKDLVHSPLSTGLRLITELSGTAQHRAEGLRAASRPCCPRRASSNQQHALPHWSGACHVAASLRRMLRQSPRPSAANRPETEALPGLPSRAAHHGLGLSREVTMKSVRSVPHCEQRNRSSVSGTSPRPCLDQGLQIGVRMMAAGVAEHRHADIAGAQRGARRGQAIIARAPIPVVRGDDAGHWRYGSCIDSLQSTANPVVAGP
jgi:hypothetical protein